MTGYAVIIEGEGDSYSAYVPDLPGCIAAGKSIAEVERLIREAIEFHIEGLSLPAPPPPPPPAAGGAAVGGAFFALNGGLPENAEWQVRFDVLDTERRDRHEPGRPVVFPQPTLMHLDQDVAAKHRSIRVLKRTDEIGFVHRL